MLTINTDKAMAIAQDKIRVWRKAQFKENDVNLQNALVDGKDTGPYVERRTYLRDLPQKCEGKTINELTLMLKELDIL
jgi:hypothetical protein